MSNKYIYSIEGTDQTLTITFKKNNQTYFAQSTLLPSSLWGLGGTFKTDTIDQPNYDALAQNLINTKIYPFLQQQGKDATFILREKAINNTIQKQPTDTAQAQNEERAQKQAQRSQIAQTLGLQTTELDVISKNTPSNKKLNGRDRLMSILVSKANELKILIIPILVRQIEQLKNSAQCPPPATLQKVIDIRNKIGNQLNSFAKFLDRATKTFTALTSAAEVIQTILQIKKIKKQVTKEATRPIPAPPGTPGALPVSLVEQQASEDATKNRQDQLISNLGNISIALATLTSVVTTVLQLLDELDALIAKCSQANLTQVDNSLRNLQQFNQEAPDTYKGFSLEVATVPFNDKISRKQGVAKNQSGIIVLKTNLSFTTTPEILIDELKFTIDTQNLKAY